MDNENFGFEALEVWKYARLFKLCNNDLIKKIPDREKFKLIDQLKRSSRSINALIAEGYGRFAYPDQIHYCVMVRGSLSESINHLIDANDEGYITAEELSSIKNQGKMVERLLNGYIIYLRKMRDSLSLGKKITKKE
jgi:four helix bundle protein